MVTEERDRFISFARTGPFCNKRAYETSVETSIYFAPDAIGRGIGTAMYRKLFERPVAPATLFSRRTLICG